VVRKYAPGGVPQGEPFFWVTDAGAANAGNEPANHPAAANAFAFGGLAGDVFVTGDWTGGGKTTAGVYRAGFWVLDAAVPGAPQAQHVPGLTSWYGGVAGDVPVPAKWPTYTKPGSLTLTSTSSNTDSATFNATWIDPSGNATNISQVQIAFATPVSMDYVTTVNGCGIMYYPPPNYTAANAGNGTLYLGSATGDNQFPYSSAIGPTGQTLSNGVCIIDAANTSFSVSGATVTLNMPVMFINAVSTNYSMFTSATNSNGFDNWVNFGQWTAPAVSLISKSVTANGGSLGGTGNTVTFAAVFTDSAGVSDMNDVQIAFSTQNIGVLNSPGLVTAQGCHLFYAVQTGILSLESAVGNGTYPSSSHIGPGGISLSNGSCEVDASQFMPTISGNTLSVTAVLTFTPASNTQYWAYTSLTSRVGPKNNGWTRFGFWQAAALPTLSCTGVNPKYIGEVRIGGIAELWPIIIEGVSPNNDPSVTVNLLVWNETKSQTAAEAISVPAHLIGAQWNASLNSNSFTQLGSYTVRAQVKRDSAIPAPLGDHRALICPGPSFFAILNDNLQPPNPVKTTCSTMVGTWTSPDTRGPLVLQRNTDGSITGTATATVQPCSGSVTWNVTEVASGGTITLTFGPASPGVFCGLIFPSKEIHNITFNNTTCDSVRDDETSTYPDGTTSSSTITLTSALSVPSTETSIFNKWDTVAGYSTEALFTMTVPPLANGQQFAGRTVTESAPTLTDGCNQLTGSVLVEPFTASQVKWAMVLGFFVTTRPMREQVRACLL